MNRDKLIEDFIETWTPPAHVEYSEGSFRTDIEQLLQDISELDQSPQQGVSEAVLLDKFEKENNPFYPNSMRWRKEMLLRLVKFIQSLPPQPNKSK